MIKTKYPIILSHGICRFDHVLNILMHTDNSGDDRLHYFRKIRSTLLEQGLEAFHSSVCWGGNIDKRAEDLKNSIETITDNFTKWDKVHIIGHSTGGLDARHMVYNYNMQDRVASISTIGTPHWGSSFADWGIKHISFLIPLAKMIGINIEGFKDLTRASCRKFNDKARDSEQKNKILYQTVGGTVPYDRVFPAFRLSHAIISREEGENDGLVSLKSAKWRDEFFIKKIDADHINELGWWHPWVSSKGFARKEFEKRIQSLYLGIAERLADKGM